MGHHEIPDQLAAAQRWGGTIQAPTESNDFQQVVKVDLSPKYTRGWALAFNAPLFTTGADNSVDRNEAAPVQLGVAAALPNPSGFISGPVIGSAQVRLRYGESAAQSEAITLDYPPRGAVYELTAAFVEVSIKDKTATASAARYSVSLNHAPSLRGRSSMHNVSIYEGLPMVSADMTAVSATGSQRVMTIPRRAIAVIARPTVNLTGLASTWRGDFYDGAGTLLGSCANGQLWGACVALPPGAQQFSLVNASGGTWNVCSVSFLLAL